jgi:hypothetical protein
MNMSTFAGTFVDFRASLADCPRMSTGLPQVDSTPSRPSGSEASEDVTLGEVYTRLGRNSRTERKSQRPIGGAQPCLPTKCSQGKQARLEQTPVSPEHVSLRMSVFVFSGCSANLSALEVCNFCGLFNHMDFMSYHTLS